MKLHINKWLQFLTTAIVTVGILSSCNKDLPDAEPINPTPPGGSSIMETLNDPSYSFLKAAITRASTVLSLTGTLSTLLADKNAVFTFFAPDDNAFKASLTVLGLPADINSINFFRPGELDTLIKYHLIGGQNYTSAKVTPAFPNLNLYLQSSFLLSAPSETLPPGYRMPIFMGKQGTILFANNIPVIQPDIEVANGVIHKVAFALLPPSQVLWQRIAADPDLTYLLAAVQKADEGDAAKTLESALKNPAANLTIFAPTNLAFQQLLTGQITLALMAQGLDQATAAATATALASTPGVFTNPAVASVLTPTTVKGIVVYHILGNRAFSVNLPVTAANYPTLLNGAIAAHPGVGLQATFGPTGVTAAAVKGAANASASNVQVNPTPAPGGTSDQHYINGVIHKIDQVLLPQ
ncbi:MAG TPA: fasciclin domain-containing protein [Chitinophagaceae bacterium]|nr:fasciclin domain-containing protein [Chitinophagaceae bacterium]